MLPLARPIFWPSHRILSSWHIRLQRCLIRPYCRRCVDTWGARDAVTQRASIGHGTRLRGWHPSYLRDTGVVLGCKATASPHVHIVARRCHESMHGDGSWLAGSWHMWRTPASAPRHTSRPRCPHVSPMLPVRPLLHCQHSAQHHLPSSVPPVASRWPGATRDRRALA